jgi:hypothetical protein
MASTGTDQHGTENELQRNKKGPLNCRECRRHVCSVISARDRGLTPRPGIRLKIRCDRRVTAFLRLQACLTLSHPFQVPCGPCIKRGVRIQHHDSQSFFSLRFFLPRSLRCVQTESWRAKVHGPPAASFSRSRRLTHTPQPYPSQHRRAPQRERIAP